MWLFTSKSLSEDEIVVRRKGQIIAMGTLAMLPCMVGSLVVADEVDVHPDGVNAQVRASRSRQ